VVLKDIDFSIERGEKIALVGRNGEGKTTLVKIIMQAIEATGMLKLGYQVKVGYYAQNQDEVLDMSKSLLDTLEEIAPMEMRPKIRNLLGYFLFSGDDVYKKVNVLSGGERARLLLAKLLLEPVNFLLLDEPTNHLDSSSKAILKKAIKQYDGTVLLVSHDRDFLDGLVDKIFEVSHTKIKQHDGDIWEFLNKKKSENLHLLFNRASKKVETETKKAYNISYTEKKEMEKKIRKVEVQIEKAEKEMLSLESKIAECDDALKRVDMKVISDYQWYLNYERMKKEYEKHFGTWEQLNKEIEVLLEEKKLKFN